VAHVGENLLSRLCDGEIALTPGITTALLQMVDAIRQVLQSIDVSGSEGERNDEELVQTLTRLQHGAAKPAEESHEMEGKEMELDKTIIEAIKDPLTHIVRNSVDHGIETPEKCIAAGKPAEGRLLLRAYHEGGQVNIEISDDGAGKPSPSWGNRVPKSARSSRSSHRLRSKPTCWL
jgi:chemotaxis protein histidine kinase CheA